MAAEHDDLSNLEIFPRRHGPWVIQRRNVPYEDPWVRLEQDDVSRPDGSLGSYCVAYIKPGVTVIAVDDERHVYLTEEFHYGVGRSTIEAVSGGVDGDEDILAAAKRELREELGLQAERWTHLGNYDPFTANVVSPTNLFLAQQLSEVPCAPDPAEIISRVRMPLHQAITDVEHGKITHMPSCLALLLASRLPLD